MEKINTLLIPKSQVSKTLNAPLTNIKIVENAMIEYINGKVIWPEKTSQIFDEILQNRINCMPATLIEKKISGVKWVSVFPENPTYNINNVNGLLILTEIISGQPIAVMDCAELTSVRTASVGACALKYLARKNCNTLGIIGSGQEAKAHLRMIVNLYPNIKKCYIASKTLDSVKIFIEQFTKEFLNIKFVNCGNELENAVRNADIIVTATSAQAPLIKRSWIKQGATYIHVGGFEDDYSVALGADKIICDNWESVKHRGSQTLSKLYQANKITDENIFANLPEIISGEKPGRENDHEFIYFNSVGLSYIDLMFGIYIYESNKNNNELSSFLFNDE